MYHKTQFDNQINPKNVLKKANLHKVHHHQDQVYTDSNYGNVFIFWDKFFGTFKELPVDKIKYGLIEFEGSKKQSFWYLLVSPFINIKRLDK